MDPYSPEAVARLTLTNLRIRLLKAQTCPAPVETSSPSSVPTPASTTESSDAAPYAIYTLMARGTCLCHGHAEVCAPHNGSRDAGQDQNTVSGFSSEFFFCTWARLHNLECMRQDVPGGKYHHFKKTLLLFTTPARSYFRFTVKGQHVARVIMELRMPRCVFQVFGRCQCVHHTAGDHCEKCAQLYNDRPWRPANSSSGESNNCQSKRARQGRGASFR